MHLNRIFNRYGSNAGSVSRASPVLHLISTNTPPLDSEIPLIESAIRDAEHDLQHLDPSAKSLKLSTQELNRFIDAHIAVLSATRRLPTEVLIRIFLMVSNILREDFRFSKYSCPAPFIIGQICHRWRTVALNIPELWSTLPHMTIGVYNAQKMSLTKREQQKISMINVLLFRSGHTCPLSFSMKILSSPAQSYTYPCLLSTVLDKLTSLSHRWENVRIEAGTRYLHLIGVAVQESLGGSRFQALRSLELVISSFLPTYPMLDMFEQAQSLREVVIDCQRIHENSYNIKMPWEQLSVFKERSGTNVRLNSVLSSAFRNLTELVFCSLGVNLDSTIPRSVLLPKLHTLQLVNCLPDVIDKITTPSLYSLSILSYSPDIIHVVSSLVTRSDCGNTLSRMVLSISPHLIESRGLVTELLSVNPRLNHARMVPIPEHDTLFLALTEALDTTEKVVKVTIHSSIEMAPPYSVNEYVASHLTAFPGDDHGEWSSCGRVVCKSTQEREKMLTSLEGLTGFALEQARNLNEKVIDIAGYYQAQGSYSKTALRKMNQLLKEVDGLGILLNGQLLHCTSLLPLMRDISSQSSAVESELLTKIRESIDALLIKWGTVISQYIEDQMCVRIGENTICYAPRGSYYRTYFNESEMIYGNDTLEDGETMKYGYDPWKAESFF